jgi:hypothetical protein
LTFGEKLAGRRKSCRSAKKLPVGEKAADRRIHCGWQESCQLAKTRQQPNKPPTGKTVDRRKSCRPAKTRRLTGEKLACRRKSCLSAKKLPVGEKAADRRKHCRPARARLLTGKKAANWQKRTSSRTSRQLAKLLTGGKAAGGNSPADRRKTRRPAKKLQTFSPVGSPSDHRPNVTRCFVSRQPFCRSAANLNHDLKFGSHSESWIMLTLSRMLTQKGSRLFVLP